MKKLKKQRLLAFSTLLIAGTLALGVAAMPATADQAETYAGTLTLTDNGGVFAGSNYHSAYHKTWVDVKDSEDLVIQYDMISSPDDLHSFGITKGLQGTDATNVDAYLENVVIHQQTKQISLGACSMYVSNAYRVQSTRSDAVKEYIYSNRSAYYASDLSYNIRFKTTGYGVNIGASATDGKGLATEGLRYKHIYHADGSYELRIQSLGERSVTINNQVEEGWQTVLQTGPTFNSALNTAGGYTIPEALKTNDEKIFVNRSGYVGFTGFATSGKTEIEIDNFKVSVTDGTTETVKINETYDCSADSLYNTNNWGYTKTGVTTLNCDIPSGEEKVVTKYNDGSVTLLDWQANALILPNNNGGMYHKTPVTVADNEDLTIEYDYLADNGYYVGIVTGMQLDGTKVVRTAGSDVETVMAMAGNSATMLGAYDSDVANAKISSYGTDTALQTYLSTKENRQHYYGNGTYSINFKAGSAGNSPVKSFRTVGYTYKHVFLASGGYECYAKEIGAADSTYALILKTADTWATDSYHGTNGCTSTAKIFANRSGYVGFIVNDGNYKNETITIDNFKVTVSGANTTTVINETYDRDYIGDTAINNWGYIAGGATTVNYKNDFTPATVDGAGIRVEVGNMTRSGIRFQTNVDNELIAFLNQNVEAGKLAKVEYGTLLTAKDLLGENEFTAEALTTAGVAYKNLVASGFNTELSTETTSGYYASLVGIQAENYYRTWVARGYVKTTDTSGTETYYYSAFDTATAGESVYEAAVALYENTEYYSGLSADAQAVIKSYIDGVVIVTLDEENGTATYAGGVTGYTAPYTLSVDAENSVLTITSTAYIRTLVVNGEQVEAEVADGAKTAVYTFRKSV